MELLALKPGGGSTLNADYVIFIEPLCYKYILQDDNLKPDVVCCQFK